MILNPSDIEKLYKANLFRDYSINVDYYNGKHKILNEDPIRHDGQVKHLTVVNYIKFLTQQMLGFMISNPITYTSATENNEGLVVLDQILTYSDAPAIDQEHLLSCLLTGKSIEIMSVVDGFPVFESDDPFDWSLLEDENDNIALAIKRECYKKGSIYQGELLRKDIIKYIVYDDESIKVYLKTETGLILESEEPHYFQECPVYAFIIEEDENPFISDDLRILNDSINYLVSNNVDLVGYMADSIFVVKGYNPLDLYEEREVRDDAGNVIKTKTKIAQIHEDHNLILDKDGEAYYVSKVQDVAAIEYALKSLKEYMHNTSSIVDFDNIINNTSISGIALKLKFITMSNAASRIEKYFNSSGLNSRINRINRINDLAGRPSVADYKIVWNYNLPEDPAIKTQNVQTPSPVAQIGTQEMMNIDSMQNN